MKQVTSLALANEIIAKLVSMIESEYDFAEFARYEYARNCANFNDENEQRDYILWSCGRLETMTKLKANADKIFDEAFVTIVNNVMEEESQ